LATLVIAYGMSINLVEVTWKGKLKQAFPNPSEYSAFMGTFSSATGVITLGMMFFGRFVFRKWGWGTAAMITPATLLVTGVAFFALCLTGNTFAAPLAALGTSPLMLAVIVGAIQNIMSKAAKCASASSRPHSLRHGHSAPCAPTASHLAMRPPRTRPLPHPRSARRPSAGTPSSTRARRWRTSRSTQSRRPRARRRSM
jgi:hypothetical protein